MTRTKAGSTPANRACGPSSRSSDNNIPSVDGAFFDLAEGPGSS